MPKLASSTCLRTFVHSDMALPVQAFWRSCALVIGQALEACFDAKLVTVEAIEEGFYVD